MILLITIPSALLLLAIFWIRNILLFKKGFASPMSIFNIEMVNMYNTFHAAPNARLLGLSKNFFNFSASLILKFIHSTIFSVVAFLCREITVLAIIVSSIYFLLVYITWYTFIKRKQFYDSIPEPQKSAFKPIFKASICLPIYQTVVYVLVFIASLGI